MALPQGSSLSPVLYNVYTKGVADLNSNGLSRMLTRADDGLIYKTASDIHTAVTYVEEQLEKVSHWCQETESEINPSKVQALWCTLNREVIELANSLRYLWIDFWQNAYIQDAGRINITHEKERTVCVESHGFKRHQTTSSVPAVSKCATKHHWLWSGSHNPVTV